MDLVLEPRCSNARAHPRWMQHRPHLPQVPPANATETYYSKRAMPAMALLDVAAMSPVHVAAGLTHPPAEMCWHEGSPSGPFPIKNLLALCLSGVSAS